MTLYLVATAFGIILGSLLSPAWVPARNGFWQGAMILALLLPTYKLLIVRLGECARDELQGPGALPELGKGIAAGFVLFSIVAAIAFALGIYKVAGRGDASGLLLGFVTVGLVPAFSEELLFRGILFRWIEEFAGSWTALVITSALFGLAHIFNPGASWFSSLAIALEAGLLLGSVYMLTRSLWMPIGLHAAWNFTEGPVFGIPVSGSPAAGLVQANIAGPPLLSGGNFGLEASLIAVVIATAAGILYLVLAVRQGELMPPSWVRPRRP
jgi:hypothetical protein